MLVFVWPASVGLALRANGWMPLLFGSVYRAGGPLLAVIALRLPWLLAVTFAQTALVSCRRENDALRLVRGMIALAIVLIPAGALSGGPWAVGLAAIVVELAGAIGGWVLLKRLGVAPRFNHDTCAALV